jgi:NAD(P)H-hydrate epimerase
MVKMVFAQAKQPLVIDADALHVLSVDDQLLSNVPAGSILTPHPGEYNRLFGTFDNWEALLMHIKTLAINTKCIWLYKRAFTIVALPTGDIWFNSTGNPGMATAGSGDVLTGLITALLAQGYTATDAALLGVYLHGLSGDIAMAMQNGQNIVAGDLIDHLQEAYAFLFESQ